MYIILYIYKCYFKKGPQASPDQRGPRLRGPAVECVFEDEMGGRPQNHQGVGRGSGANRHCSVVARGRS